MAFPSIAPTPLSEHRIPLARIDAVVSARLGPTRGLGNVQPTCFNRQIAMYLAARIGRWSTTAIGRFYNGRDHSTVCYGIQRIESLKESNPEVDTLLSDLKRQLAAAEEEIHPHSNTTAAALAFTRRSFLSQAEIDWIADRVAARVLTLLRGKFG